MEEKLTLKKQQNEYILYMIQVSNHFLPYLLLCPTFLCIKKFRMMSMIQARAPLQYGIISTTTMRKKSEHQ